jgi:hypothetical protein
VLEQDLKRHPCLFEAGESPTDELTEYEFSDVNQYIYIVAIQ